MFASTPMTYSIQGMADHSHDVTFTVAQLAQLRSGQSVSVDSTETLAHFHMVTVACT